MAQGFFEELKSFLLWGLYGDEDHDEGRDEGYRNGSETDCHLCDGYSIYGQRGDGSLLDYPDESVCEPSYDLGSVLDYRPDESVCESAKLAGTTAFYKRPPAAARACPPPKPGGPYQARAEDPIDSEIADFFRQHPEAYTYARGFTRISPGHYLLHGREIIVDRQPVDTLMELMGDKGQLVVRDGPLTQPLADYLTNKDSSAEYSGSVFQVRNALQTIPQDCRMTFHDTGAGYSRIEAMKVAKEQALTREKAAKMINQGQQTGDLVAKYEKTIDKKLGWGRTPEKTISFASASGSPSNAMLGVTSPGARHLSSGAGVRSSGTLRSTGTPQAHRSATQILRAGGV